MNLIFSHLQDESARKSLASHLLSVRLSILQMHHKSQTSHVGSSLSCADIVFLLCQEKQIRQKSRLAHNFDIIFSKGHAATAFYAALKEIGELSEAELDTYCKGGSQLYGHISHLAHPWIPLSTGSLGHGLPFGLGLALAKRERKTGGLTAVVVSDGEMNEGTTWESALIASSLKLSNLVCFVDANGIQSLDFVEKVLPLEPLSAKWKSFGWNVLEMDGHNHSNFTSIALHDSKPTVVVLRTVKGKGVSFMENLLLWHYKSPTTEELERATKDLMQEFGPEGLV